jgi:hypothetical protein
VVCVSFLTKHRTPNGEWESRLTNSVRMDFDVFIHAVDELVRARAEFLRQQPSAAAPSMAGVVLN